MKKQNKNTPRCKICSLLIYSKKRIKTKNKQEWLHITCYKRRAIENAIIKKDIQKHKNIFYDIENKYEIKNESKYDVRV